MTRDGSASPILRVAQRFRANGLKGVAVAAFLRIPVVGWAFGWWLRDHPWLGRCVETLGNRVAVEGCTFSLGGPGISRAMKSRFVLGRYEREERHIIRRFLPPHLPVIELGGGLGVVACLVNKRLANPDRHVVVEANPALITALHANRDLNQCRFEVVHGALAYGGTDCTFFQHADFVSGGLAHRQGTAVTVPTLNLSRVLVSRAIDRCTLISDIEGGEVDLVSNEKEILGAHVYCLILEVHPTIVGAPAIRSLLQTLATVGLECAHRRGDVYVFRNETLSKVSIGRAGCPPKQE